jgi:hypothetical protein
LPDFHAGAAYRQRNASLLDRLRDMEIVVDGAALCAAACVVAVAIGYTFLAYPQADDILGALQRRAYSPLEQVLYYYRVIDGRWASIFLESVAYTGDLVWRIYPGLLLAGLAISLLGCCCGVAIATGWRPLSPRTIAGSVMVYAFLWSCAPFGEAFYWFPAMMDYTVPVALGMMLLWVMLNWTEPAGRITAIGMALLIPAIHEVCGGWIAPVLGVVWLIKLMQPPSASGTTAGRGAWRVAAACLAATLGFVSVVGAPGIRNRMAVYADPGLPFPAALADALHVWARVALEWKVVVPVLLMITLLTARLRQPPAWLAVAPTLSKFCLLAAAFGMPIAVLTAADMAIGGAAGTGRLIDGLFFLTFAALAMFAVSVGRDVGCTPQLREFLEGPWGAAVRIGVASLCLVQTVGLHRVSAAVREIPAAVQNLQTVQQRLADIQRERDAGATDIVVPRLIPLTILPTWIDLHDDPTWYANENMAFYFGVKTIRLAGSQAAKP